MANETRCAQCNGTVRWDMPSARWEHNDLEQTHDPVMAPGGSVAPNPGLVPQETPDDYLAAHAEGIDDFYGSYDEASQAVRFERIRAAHEKLHQDSGCHLRHCPYYPCGNAHCDLCRPARTL